jgi:hypothetical protein
MVEMDEKQEAVALLVIFVIFGIIAPLFIYRNQIFWGFLIASSNVISFSILFSVVFENILRGKASYGI